MSEDLVRIQKFIADAGVCSRRAAEALIAEGEVWVNGRRAEPGQKIDPAADKVVVEGIRVNAVAQPRITVAVHKPRGLICSNDDPHNPDTVFALLPPLLARHRFFIAGRLDKDSEGLVVLTTDGDLAQRLTHPSNEVTKRYHVVLEKPFPRTRIPRLLAGVKVEGEWLKVEHASPVNPDGGGLATTWDVHLHHGKKREIRQLFLALGHPVERLRRYQIGAFTLRGLRLGAGKQLSPAEIESLFAQPGLSPRRSGARPVAADGEQRRPDRSRTRATARTGATGRKTAGPRTRRPAK